MSVVNGDAVHFEDVPNFVYYNSVRGFNAVRLRNVVDVV